MPGPVCLDANPFISNTQYNAAGCVQKSKGATAERNQRCKKAITLVKHKFERALNAEYDEAATGVDLPNVAVTVSQHLLS